MIKDGDDNVLTSERSVKMEGVLWGCDECRNERMTENQEAQRIE